MLSSVVVWIAIVLCLYLNIGLAPASISNYIACCSIINYRGVCSNKYRYEICFELQLRLHKRHTPPCDHPHFH